MAGVRTTPETYEANCDNGRSDCRTGIARYWATHAWDYLSRSKKDWKDSCMASKL